MNNIIASLDLGSDTIKIVVAEVKNGKVNVLAATQTKSKGIKRGLIVEPDLTIEAVKEAKQKTEELLGAAINKFVVSIPSNYANFELGRGTTTINKDVGFVSGNDIVRAIQGSVYNKIPENMELITIIPVEFIVDEKTRTRNPKSMSADKLEVKTIIITTPKKNVYSVLSVLDNCGISVSDIVIGSIGDYYAFNSETTDQESGVVINIGHETSTVTIYNKGVPINTEILEIGNSNIDNDISFIYKINSNDAKFLKENLALGYIRNADANETEEIVDKLGEKIKINQYEISEIVSSRIDEILKITKKQINLLTKKEISYIIITGGITEIKDFSLSVENVYGKSATIGVMNTIGVRSGIYSCSLGIIKYFNSKMLLRNKEYSVFSEREFEEFVDGSRKMNINNDSILGKIFAYFFDN